MTVSAPAPIALEISPEKRIPPSAIIEISSSFSAALISIIAVICGTPIPAIILVVQIEPGPIPTFTPSAPASLKAIAPSAVATLPPITSIPLNSCLIILMVSITFFECPCALSTTNKSIPALTNSAALSRVSAPVPIAAPTINCPC